MKFRYDKRIILLVVTAFSFFTVSNIMLGKFYDAGFCFFIAVVAWGYLEEIE